MTAEVYAWLFLLELYARISLFHMYVLCMFYVMFYIRAALLV